MAKKTKTIGELPPRYQFLLNPYSQIRLSKCPQCRRPTHKRKFALFIHIDDWGAAVLGKTCRYCTPCELIIAHQDELEAELFGQSQFRDPAQVGRRYLVIGTVDKKVWQTSLNVEPSEQMGKALLASTAEFKGHRQLIVEHGGWQPA